MFNTKYSSSFSDEENIKLYRRLYNIDFGRDTKPFELVIDTNNKNPDEIADIIINELKKRHDA